MNRVIRATFIVGAIISTGAYGDTTPSLVSDEEILNYATRSYDKNHIAQSRMILGSHGGTTVLVEYICSDLCPDYTVRVIHYELSKDQKCSDVGGVEKEVRIPVAIAAMNRIFCFPKVLADNWKSYTKVQ